MRLKSGIPEVVELTRNNNCASPLTHCSNEQPFYHHPFTLLLKPINLPGGLFNSFIPYSEVVYNLHVIDIFIRDIMRSYNQPSFFLVDRNDKRYSYGITEKNSHSTLSCFWYFHFNRFTYNRFTHQKRSTVYFKQRNRKLCVIIP